jgi:hypothetical protein
MRLKKRGRCCPSIWPVHVEWGEAIYALSTSQLSRLPIQTSALSSPQFAASHKLLYTSSSYSGTSRYWTVSSRQSARTRLLFEMDTSIFQAHCNCVSLFLAFSKSLQDRERDNTTSSTKKSKSSFEDAFDKYNLWAGNMGAMNSGQQYSKSLDYRLREASFSEYRF